jgi:hypothetical protein
VRRTRATDKMHSEHAALGEGVRSIGCRAPCRGARLLSACAELVLSGARVLSVRGVFFLCLGVLFCLFVSGWLHLFAWPLQKVSPTSFCARVHHRPQTPSACASWSHTQRMPKLVTRVRSFPIPVLARTERGGRAGACGGVRGGGEEGTEERYACVYRRAKLSLSLLPAL